MQYLTVEEISARFDVPVSTVRRWCSEGALHAEKHGRQWLVKEEELPSSPPRRRTQQRRVAIQSSHYDIKQAQQHVINTDLREVWVPDVIDFQDVPLDDQLLSRVNSRMNENVASPSTEVPIPKTPFFTRSAVLLSLEDRIGYQATVASFADKADKLTSPNVYSARLAEQPSRYFFKQKGTSAWLEFRKAVRSEYEATKEWLVKTDLTAYFDTISHDLLISEVTSLNVPPKTIGLLRMMLRTWATVPGQGIPQGPNASRLLGNLFLIPIDRAMVDKGYRYFRYLDDVYIVADTREEAAAAIRLFERECRLRGLLVSSSKTKPLHGKNAQAEISSEADLDAIQYMIDSDQLPAARRRLRKVLNSALKDDGQIDTRRARFSFWRLTLLRESSMLNSVLTRLEDTAPVASAAMAYLRPFLTRPQVNRGITTFLQDKERASSPFILTWVLALLLDHPGPIPREWIVAARTFTHDRNQPSYLRSVAANVMARGHEVADLSWLRSEIAREFDPALMRGYIVALARADTLDKNSVKTVVARSPELATLTQYLQGRKTLPSLLLRDQFNRIGK